MPRALKSAGGIAAVARARHRPASAAEVLDAIARDLRIARYGRDAVDEAAQPLVVAAAAMLVVLLGGYGVREARRFAAIEQQPRARR